MAYPTDGSPDSDRAAKLQGVQDSVERVGGDISSLGSSLKDWLEAQTRERPLQTVAVALAIGWLIGKRA